MIKDKQSPEWLLVKALCQGRIAELREENDGQHDMVDTSEIRGKIAFAKEVLALEEPANKDQVKSESYID